ncbi:MAG: MoaD/ThiS family protein [Candidatus Heimdallarchaeota archaeon]|nr:MoaD/ThiS family protein [Candidatus Heimdallarchaeota archaeon]
MILLEYYSIKIILHPSIPSVQRLIEGKIDAETNLLDGLIFLLSEHEKVVNILISDSDLRPGYLILSDKVELKSTGKLYFPVKSDMEIRIIPISHGG